MSNDKPFNSGQWTAARYRGFIKSGLRNTSQRWPVRYETLNLAKRGKKINALTGRLAEHYECNSCKGIFPAKNVEVNHIIPVVPVTGWDDWNGLIQRLFCEAEGLEVLCRDCHKEVSKQENIIRKENK